MQESPRLGSTSQQGSCLWIGVSRPSTTALPDSLIVLRALCCALHFLEARWDRGSAQLSTTLTKASAVWISNWSNRILFDNFGTSDRCIGIMYLLP